MWLQWFGEQSEAVKLALIGLVSAIGAGMFGIVKEWRKPVLAAQPMPTVATRPADDDPVVLLASAQEATNFALAEIRAGQAQGNAAIVAHLEKITDELRDIRQEIVVTREVSARRGR